jgi:hypothetical protein
MLLDTTRISGPNAPRYDPRIQEAFYTGWKKLFGIKWQTVILPNGMYFHVYGGPSARHNDLFTLRDSDINAKIALLQLGLAIQYKMYGDAIYPHLSHLFSMHDGPNLTERQKAENKSMKSVRQPVEWSYAEIGNMFPFTTYTKKQQLRKKLVPETYFTALFLRECFVCLNGNNTSK